MTITDQPSRTKAAGPGFWSMVGLGVGTIGVAWIVLSGGWILYAGPLGATLALIVGGLFIGFVGLCYGEIASMFPVAGGEYVYFGEAFGAGPGFMTGWFLAFIYIAVTAFEAISLGWLCSELFPGHEGATLYTFMGAPVHVMGLATGLLGTCIIAWVNARGIGLTMTLQNALALLLVVLASVFVAAAALRGDVTHLRPLIDHPEGGSFWSGVGAVLAVTPFLLAGFNTIPQALAERSERLPLRAVVQAISLVIGVAVLFYVAVVFAVACVVDRAELTRASLPAAHAFEIAFGNPILKDVILLAGIRGIITTQNATFFAATRVLLALSQAGSLPAALVRRGASGSPVVAVAVVTVLSCTAVFAGRGAVAPLANVAGLVFALLFGLTCVTVPVLRIRRPDAPRPFLVPAARVVVPLGIAAAALMACAALWELTARGTRWTTELSVVVVWACTGLGFWWLWARSRQRRAAGATAQASA